VRVIDGPLAGVRYPMFQTSANLSGEPSPSSFAGVVPEVKDAVDLAIDGGRLTGLPSTVVDLTDYDENGTWVVLREGGMSRGDLVAALGR
jgi:L-threonylcarbamoyladenylate synthase